MDTQKPSRSPLPVWLVGLLIAVVVFVVVLVVANMLGFGDDPAIGASAVLPLL